MEVGRYSPPLGFLPLFFVMTGSDDTGEEGLDLASDGGEGVWMGSPGP